MVGGRGSGKLCGQEVPAQADLCAPNDIGGQDKAEEEQAARVGRGSMIALRLIDNLLWRRFGCRAKKERSMGCVECAFTTTLEAMQVGAT